MRIAFAFWPTSAHLNPLVPLAWAFKVAGHDVVFTSHPSAGGDVSRAGLPFVPACTVEEMPAPAGPGSEWTQAREVVASVTDRLGVPEGYDLEWQTVSQGFLPSMWDFTSFSGDAATPLPAIDGMVAFFRAWKPDLVIWDPCMPGAAVAARAVGAMQIRQCGTDQFGWYQDTFEQRTQELGVDGSLPNPFVETVRGPAERHGVDIDRDLLYGDWTLSHVPDELNLPVHTSRIPMAWVPYVAQEPMPAWLHAPRDRPRVALSLGTSLRQYVQDLDWSYLQGALDALRSLDVEVVATLDELQCSQLDLDPRSVRVVDFLPLDQLVPTCDLLIHHGGLGTSVTASVAGVPQLVLDYLADDGDRYKLAPIVGDYVAGWRAGGVLDLSGASSDDLAVRIDDVLRSQEARQGAEELRASVAERPMPSDVVGTLERLVMGRIA
ncbi:MAG: nucleotide disphospho-sugar-binding domain-containing protein [Knoellia sp.]